MKPLAQITEELIQDAERACRNKGYLRRLLRQYFESLPPEDRRVIYDELIKDLP